jgi:hypothetical protein
MSWQVDCERQLMRNGRYYVWAYNPDSKRLTSRTGHFVLVQQLRKAHVPIPNLVGMAWEVDWTKRAPRHQAGKGHGESLVWARNPRSVLRSAREWHWASPRHLRDLGVDVERKVTGRQISTYGYVTLRRMAMTDEEIALADAHNLFTADGVCLEHRLRALQLYGEITPVVRHFNGVKSDNRPTNLLLGTSAENTADHQQARLLAMYWHSRFRLLAQKYNALLKIAGDQQTGFDFESAAIPDSDVFAQMPKNTTPNKESRCGGFRNTR